MSKRLLDRDPLAGISTYHHYDHQTKTTAIETVQDVGPHLERAKKFAADSERKKRGIKKSWMHAATIPHIVQMQWLIEQRERGASFREADLVGRALRGDKLAQRRIVHRINTDPQYRDLKVIPGKI